MQKNQKALKGYSREELSKRNSIKLQRLVDKQMLNQKDLKIVNEILERRTRKRRQVYPQGQPVKLTTVTPENNCTSSKPVKNNTHWLQRLIHRVFK
jgi:hypothetical protein